MTCKILIRYTWHEQPGHNRAATSATIDRSQRSHDHQMAALRKGLLDAGLAPSIDPFREFFTGRHPA